MRREFINNPPDQGAALLELSLVLVIFLFVGFASIDLARMFHVYEKMSDVSREAARISFQQCETDDFETCIATNQIFNTLKVYLDQSIPGCELAISAYDRVSVTGSPDQIVIAGRAGLPLLASRFQTPVLGESSRVDAAQLSAVVGTSNGSMFFDYTTLTTPPIVGPRKLRVVVGEVFCQLTALAPQSYLFLPRTDVLYEVTLL